MIVTETFQGMMSHPVISSLLKVQNIVFVIHFEDDEDKTDREWYYQMMQICNAGIERRCG